MKIFTPIIVEKINELVTLLNEDLKKNERSKHSNIRRAKKQTIS